MWNFFFRRRQRQQGQGFRFTVIAPQARGQDETVALRENIDDLGAAAALQQVIEESRPRGDRTMSSQTTSLQVTTRVSAVSEDSEEYILNPYTDSGRRQTGQEVVSPSSPLATAPPAQATSFIEEDYVDVDRPNGGDLGEQPRSFRNNLMMDPLGTLLHTTAAATLASGPPGRRFITSGPPPPNQRGRRARSSSEARPPPTPGVPRPLVLTQRRRAASCPVYSARPRNSGGKRSARSL